MAIPKHSPCYSPSNPEGLSTLWVGNVLKEVIDVAIKKMFSK